MVEPAPVPMPAEKTNRAYSSSHTMKLKLSEFVSFHFVKFAVFIHQASLNSFRLTEYADFSAFINIMKTGFCANKTG